MRKILLILLSLIIIISMTGLGGITYAAGNVPEGYERVARTSALSLYFNEETHAIAVEDMRNGYIWRSAVDESRYDSGKLNALWVSYMKSLMAINYTQIDSVKSVVLTIYSEGTPCTFNWEKSGNGLILDYYFTGVQIGLSMEIELVEDRLVVNIPNEKIREDGGLGLVSVEVLPFFGAEDKSTDGYVFYPDGCGALMIYQNRDNKAKNINKKTYYIYGNENVDIDEYKKMEDTNKYNASLPVFGVKNEENAFFAIATRGDNEAKINLSIEGNMVDFNRTAFEYTYRHLFDIILSNVQVNKSNIAQESKGVKADKDFFRQDYETSFVFLQGNDANYSGMANAYRDYLIASGGIKKVIEENSPIPLAVDFLMGIVEDRLLFDKFITMTSFEQAEEITENLIEKGIGTMQVKLSGWASGGYGKFPVNWPPEKKVGGSKGLREYSDYLSQKNIDLFMQVNFVDAIGKSGGFSKRDDIVYQGNTMPVIDKLKNRYLLNPTASYGMYQSFMNNFRNFGSIGVAFEKTGTVIYHDYNKNNPSSRMQTMKQWEKMLSETSVISKVAVEGGNAYTLKYADRLFGIPAGTSEYYFTDEAVPFYQMVVHGLIPYTTEAGNLFHDPVNQKLKWVEYGCMPYFELTYQKSKEIKYTKYNSLFTSHYDEWINTAAKIYEEFNDRLSSVWSEYMTGHEIISEDLVKVSYSNGTVIYINYGDSDVIYDTSIVKAQDYLVLEGGE